MRSCINEERERVQRANQATSFSPSFIFPPDENKCDNFVKSMLGKAQIKKIIRKEVLPDNVL